jgi:hypothetical protein
VSYAKTMRQALGSDDDRFMPSFALRTVKAGLAEVVARWINLLGSEGKAARP